MKGVIKMIYIRKDQAKWIDNHQSMNFSGLCRDFIDEMMLDDKSFHKKKK